MAHESSLLVNRTTRPVTLPRCARRRCSSAYCTASRENP